MTNINKTISNKTRLKCTYIKSALSRSLAFLRFSKGKKFRHYGTRYLAGMSITAKVALKSCEFSCQEGRIRFLDADPVLDSEPDTKRLFSIRRVPVQPHRETGTFLMIFLTVVLSLISFVQ
jgi:hypothetical protein